MTRAEFAKRAAALDSLQQAVLKTLQTVPAADHGTIFRLGLAWANLRLSILMDALLAEGPASGPRGHKMMAHGPVIQFMARSSMYHPVFIN